VLAGPVSLASAGSPSPSAVPFSITQGTCPLEPKGAALGLTVVSTFTYTLESLIQAGKSLVAVDHVPACTNGKTRESRLFKSMSSYIGPQRRRDFPNLHGVRAAQGLLLDRRARPVRRDRRVERPFLWGWLVHGNRSGHLQSIILGGVLLMAAIQIFALGVLADLIASQRIVTQRTLERVRRIELELGVRPSHYQQGSSRPDGEDDDQVPRGQLDAMRS
jgi:hypothetical protein